MKLTYNSITKILSSLYHEQQIYFNEKSQKTKDYIKLCDEISYYEKLHKKLINI